MVKVTCPYCECLCVGYNTPDDFRVDDAMLCANCGNIGTFKDGYEIEKHTDKDIERWSLSNPIAWERVEMMAADYKRDCAARERGEDT